VTGPAPDPSREARFSFPGLGTLVEVAARFEDPPRPAEAFRQMHDAVPAALAAAARRLVEDIEAQLSRFREDSDVARLGRAGGAWAPVGNHTRAVLEAAAGLRAATEGLFDPAAPGRLFATRDRPEPVPAACPASPSRWAGEARVEAPGGLDLGAIGKGYAADQLLRLCQEHGAAAAMAGVGVSSITLWAPPGQRPWRIGLRSPGGARDEALGVLELRQGAVAASSMDEKPGHVADPRDGRPAASDLRQATVLAPDGMLAEACSTALLVGGTALAARLAARLPEVACVLVTDAAVLVSPALRRSFQPGPQPAPPS
jgi:thiamine biosynthesis lipoprotein